MKLHRVSRFALAIGLLALPAAARAQAFGLKTVLVRTGKFRPDDLERSGVNPDMVVSAIADLPAWLERAL